MLLKNFTRGLTSVTKYAVCLLLLSSSNIVCAYEGDRTLREEAQVLHNYSFDFKEHKPPLAYDTYGAAVQVHHLIKLIPEVKERFGAIVMNKEIKSDRKF